MKKWLKRRFALSDQGAADTIKGSLASALQNIALMLPVALLYLLINGTMNLTNWANVPPKEFNARIAHAGAKRPTTNPMAIATMSFVSAKSLNLRTFIPKDPS